MRRNSNTCACGEPIDAGDACSFCVAVEGGDVDAIASEVATEWEKLEALRAARKVKVSNA